MTIGSYLAIWRRSKTEAANVREQAVADLAAQFIIHNASLNVNAENSLQAAEGFVTAVELFFQSPGGGGR